MNNMMVLKKLTKRDIPVMVSLINSIYTIKKNYEYFLWHCFETVHSVVTIGCFIDGEFVGMFGVHKKILTNGLTCGQAKSMNVVPQWRGKGYFTKLGEMAFEYFDGLDVMCVFANENARIPCEKAFGMKTIGSIRMIFLATFENVYNPQGIRCSLINQNTIFGSFGNADKNIVGFKTSQEYRSWRYASNPHYSYYIVEIDEGGYAVVKNFVNPVTNDVYGDIVDIECDTEDAIKLRKIVMGSCWCLKELGATKITIWAMPDTLLRSIVEEMGFRESNYSSYFNVKVLNPKYDYLYDFSRWLLRQSDAENY